MKTLRFLATNKEDCPFINCQQEEPHAHVIPGVGVSYLPESDEVVLDLHLIGQSFEQYETMLASKS